MGEFDSQGYNGFEHICENLSKPAVTSHVRKTCKVSKISVMDSVALQESSHA